MHHEYRERVELVFLHGPAASGKLTIARELSALTGLPVFHNHLVVDVLLEVFEFGGPEFVRLRERFWMETFDARGARRPFHDLHVLPRAHRAAGISRAGRLMRGRAWRARPLRGGASLDARAGTPGREPGSHPDRTRFRRLSDVESLRRVRATGAAATETPPADLAIDTETVQPAEAARLLRDAFGLGVRDQQAPRCAPLR